MKTLLFAPLFLDEAGRYERNIRWLDYYVPLKDKLGFEEILFVDNASGPILDKFEEEIKKYPIKITIIKRTMRFKRISEHAYGYWYAAFSRAASYGMENKFDKILHMDTDLFVITDKLMVYLKTASTGWIAFWAPRYNFAESTFQIIGSDQFKNVHQFMTEDFLRFYPYGLAEIEIPWTHVEKGFIGDRYAEMRSDLPRNADFSAQTNLAMKLP